MDNAKKRIAKNTLFLYARMLLLMAVSLYTSRIVLNALGIVDYGIFNVVGGITAFVGFLNGSLNSSTQRFLNVEMVKDDNRSVNNVFCQSINAHLIIGLVCVILLETLGLWFVSNKLVIPENQYTNAIWVFECSVLVLFVSIMCVPEKG